MPVEALAIGDRIITLAGEARPVHWIGRRAYDGRFIAGNRQVLPIRIAAGALADGVPASDLWVSPGHSMYIDGVLVMAEHLVNGATIVQAESVEEVEYFHIELETQDIIFANGAATESYIDCDNRLMFANGAEYERLYPDDDRPRWAFCLPRLDWGSDELTRIRAAVLRRAAMLGHDTDQDPELHLIVDGAAVQPSVISGRSYRFAVPAGSRVVRLVSRVSVPAEVEPESRDIRRLGVAVERLALYDDNLSIEIRHGHAMLRDGFHEDEASHRWTDGTGRVPDGPVCSFPGEFTLEVSLASCGLLYRAASPADAADAA